MSNYTSNNRLTITARKSSAPGNNPDSKTGLRYDQIALGFSHLHLHFPVSIRAKSASAFLLRLDLGPEQWLERIVDAGGGRYSLG